MILGDAEEIITSVEIDDETYEEIVRVRIRLFVSHSISAWKVIHSSRRNRESIHRSKLEKKTLTLVDFAIFL
jgi:hypothetical protein